MAVRKNTLVMVGIAAVFGLLAVFVAQAWLNHQAELRMRGMPVAKQQEIPTRTIVVATMPLRFGTPLTPEHLREVPWSEQAIPAGTFGTIKDLMSGEKRVVLAAIQPNEPILRSKVTGAGQKATLSALIQDGKRAVTIRVNDVEGVGGFVLPGDHVDVLLTRQPEKEIKVPGSTDVVLQNTRVLAIDQLADDSADKATVVKAVTLEVDTIEAQKIALASSLGSLSLILRKAGELHLGQTRRVTTSDLTETEVVQPVATGNRFAKIAVTRGTNRQEYNVPAEDAGLRAAEQTSPARSIR
jgi:pilus assembly protein CpaB